MTSSFFITMTPEQPLVGQSCSLRLCARSDHATVRRFAWFAHISEQSPIPGHFPGEPVVVQFQRPGLQTVHAHRDAVWQDNPALIVASGDFLVSECLSQEIAFLLSSNRDRASWFQEICRRLPLDQQRRRDLDACLSHHLRDPSAGEDRQLGALTLLVQLYSPAVLALARRAEQAGNVPDDVLNDAWSRAWQGLAGFRRDPTERPFGPWFLTIARHILADRGKTNARDWEVAQKAGPELYARVNVLDAYQLAERADLLDAVRRCIAEQARGNIAKQCAIERRLLDGATLREIAQEIGCPLPTVYRWVLEAGSALRKRFAGT